MTHSRLFLFVFLVGLTTMTASAQTREVLIMPSDGEPLDYFGNSVSLSGDYALIGSLWDDDNGSNSGSAYVYHFDGSEWVEEAKLLPPAGATQYQFGVSVSISGNTALIGTYSYVSVAYVFENDGSDWMEVATLTPSIYVPEDWFGLSVSISDDYALVGAYGDGEKGQDAGAAYVFYNDGSGWVEQAKLTASDGAATDFFGQCVLISGDRVFVGAYNNEAGAVYVFERSGNGWQEKAKLSAGDGEMYDAFGASISTSEDNVLIGAPYDDDGANETGSAYVFHYDGLEWNEEAKLVALDGQADDFFGASVALWGDLAILGAYGDDDNGERTGSTYLFQNGGSGWNQQSKLTASDGEAGDYFGGSLSFSDRFALVGAYHNNGIGSAYVYSDFAQVQSPLTVLIEVDSSDVPVPREGGNVSFHVTIVNETPDSVITSISCDLHDDGGNAQPIVLEKDVLMIGGAMREKDHTFHIPAEAPEGWYAVVVIWKIGGVEYSVASSFEKTNVEPSEPLMSLTHSPGNLNIGIFNDGSIGADQLTYLGPGITWRGVNGCFVGGPVFGTSAVGSVNGLVGSFQLFGDLLNVQSNFAGGFTSNADFDQIASADLNDSNAPIPYGVKILQRSYTNTGEEFGIIRYGYVNQSSQDLVDFYAGIFLDWDIRNFLTNTGAYDQDRGLVYNWDAVGATDYFGLAAITEISGARTTANGVVAVREESFEYISTFDFDIPGNGDYRTWIGSGPFDLPANDTVWVTFSVMAGDDLEELLANADAARDKASAVGWDLRLTSIDLPSEKPGSFGLSQNYPNPFNPSTTFRYSLSTPANVTLKVYDMLGQLVRTVVEEHQAEGYYESVWDGRNETGATVASGIYVYRLTAGDFVETKRMVMMK